MPGRLYVSEDHRIEELAKVAHEASEDEMERAWSMEDDGPFDRNTWEEVAEPIKEYWKNVVRAVDKRIRQDTMGG